MNYRDNLSDQSFQIAIPPKTINSNTTTNGNWIDLQNFKSCTFVFCLGTRTDGTFTPLIEEADADNQSDAAAVADIDLLPAGTGQEAANALNASNTIKKIGYVGNKRYVRASLVSTSVASGSLAGAAAVLGTPSIAEVA